SWGRRRKETVRKISAVLLSAFGLALAPAGAIAQDAHPTRPILLTHGNTPGSNSDLMARIIADPLAARLGQPVIVASRRRTDHRLRPHRERHAGRLHADHDAQRASDRGCRVQDAE